MGGAWEEEEDGGVGGAWDEGSGSVGEVWEGESSSVERERASDKRRARRDKEKGRESEAEASGPRDLLFFMRDRKSLTEISQVRVSFSLK